MTPQEDAVLRDLLRSVSIGGKPLTEHDIAAHVAGPVLLGLLRTARQSMQNTYYDRPRIGMEMRCEAIDAVLATLPRPAEPPAANQTRDDGASEG